MTQIFHCRTFTTVMKTYSYIIQKATYETLTRYILCFCRVPTYFRFAFTLFILIVVRLDLAHILKNCFFAWRVSEKTSTSNEEIITRLLKHTSSVPRHSLFLADGATVTTRTFHITRLQFLVDFCVSSHPGQITVKSSINTKI